MTSADLRHTKAPLKAVENLLMNKRWQVTPRPLDAWHGSEKTPEQTPSCYAYGCKARPDRRRGAPCSRGPGAGDCTAGGRGQDQEPEHQRPPHAPSASLWTCGAGTRSCPLTTRRTDHAPAPSAPGPNRVTPKRTVGETCSRSCRPPGTQGTCPLTCSLVMNLITVRPYPF